MCNDDFWLEEKQQGNFSAFGDIMRGDPGPYYTPAVDENGNLSWTNNGNLPNPETVNIKGEKGDPGDLEFIAIYDETTYDEIAEAEREGRLIVAKDSGFVSDEYYQLSDGEMGSDIWGSYNAYVFTRFDVDSQNNKTLFVVRCKKYDGSTATTWERESLPVDLADDLLEPVEQTIKPTTLGPAAIATFDASAADMPLKGLTVDIEPVQDLHGYDHPWPAGGGKNIFDEANADWVVGKVINSAGDIIDNSGYKYSNAYMPISGNTQYCFQYNKGSSVTSGMIVAFYDSNKNFISRPYAIDNTASTGLLYGYLTTPANAAYFSLNVSRTDSTEIQVAIGSTATAYEPYSNICPITGWTGCNVTRTGKNLWKSSYTQIYNGVTLTVDSDGGCSLTGAPTAQARFIENVSIPAGTYYLSANNSEAISTGVRLLLVSDKGGATIQMYLGSANRGMVVTLPVEYSQIRITVNEGAAFTNTKFYPQLELGSTATAYEPYQGDTYNVAFPSPDPGTVYGGTLDVVNKKLTVTHKEIVIDQRATISKTGNNFYFRVPDMVKKSDYIGSIFCDRLPVARNHTTMDWNQIGGYYDSAGTYPNNNWLYWSISGITTLADMQTWLTSNPLTVVYELATPITYDLTADEVTTLLGTNNIWADCGDVTVTYGAYLETVKAHADRLGDSILSAIAPLEASYTASRTYAVGSYLFVGTKFYKVTAAIGSGDTINPGTNVTQTTVAAQLMELGTLRISSESGSIRINAGEYAFFTVNAVGGTAPYTYKWYVSTDGGDTWRNTTANGYNTNTLYFKVASSYNGFMYRCNITDGNGNVITSTPVTLTIVS